MREPSETQIIGESFRAVLVVVLNKRPIVFHVGNASVLAAYIDFVR